MVQNNILCNVFLFFLLLFVFCVLKWPLRGCYVLFFCVFNGVFPCFVVCCAECRKQYCRSCLRGTSAAEGDSALIASVTCALNSQCHVSFSCFYGDVCLYFFVKKYSKNSGCRLAGRHLLCSQVASDILRSLRGLPLAVCRKCLGRQRLAALKHVSGFPAHCSTCSLRLRNAAISLSATNYFCYGKPQQK